MPLTKEEPRARKKNRLHWKGREKLEKKNDLRGNGNRENLGGERKRGGKEKLGGLTLHTVLRSPETIVRQQKG